MVLMCAQECLRLGTKLRVVRAMAEARQVNRRLAAHLVLEVRVDGLALLLLDELDRSRRRRRIPSSIGIVTSCHQSSVCTS
jgi:hypothetical protein